MSEYISFENSLGKNECLACRLMIQRLDKRRIQHWTNAEGFGGLKSHLHDTRTKRNEVCTAYGLRSPNEVPA